MRFVIQRVTSANVAVDSRIVGKIEKGFLVFVGIAQTDTREIADKMLKKLLGLRIFEDENAKTNLDLQAVEGSILFVSQFTLYADCKKGNRPSFVQTGAPDMAKELFSYIIEKCKELLSEERIQQGIFGADMKVSLINDGPFTILLDSSELSIR